MANQTYVTVNVSANVGPIVAASVSLFVSGRTYTNTTDST
jgi:hypothetical protein